MAGHVSGFPGWFISSEYTVMGRPIASIVICAGWLVCNASQAPPPLNPSQLLRIKTTSGKSTPPDSLLPLSGT